MAESPSVQTFLIKDLTISYPIAVLIKGDRYCLVEIDGVGIVDRSKYDIVRNSIVFNDTSILKIGSVMTVKVVQTDEALGELGTTTSTQIVANSIGDINAVASELAKVTDVFNNLSHIVINSDNMQSIVTALANANVAETQAYNSSLNAEACQQSQNRVLASEQRIRDLVTDFDERYLGSATADPTVDNHGQPLKEGVLYFNTTSNRLLVFNGTVWTASTIDFASVNDVTKGTDNIKAVTSKSLDGIVERFRADYNEVTAGLINTKFVTPKSLLEAGSRGQRLVFIRNSTNTGYTTLMPYNISQHSIFGLYFDDIGQAKSLNSTIDWLFKPKADLNGQLLQLLDADIDGFLKGQLTVINEVGVSDPTQMKSFKDLALMVRGRVWVGDITIEDSYHLSNNKPFTQDLTAIKNLVLSNTGISFAGKPLSLYIEDAYLKGDSLNGRHVYTWRWRGVMLLEQVIEIGTAAFVPDTNKYEGGILEIKQEADNLNFTVLDMTGVATDFFLHVNLKDIYVNIN